MNLSSVTLRLYYLILSEVGTQVYPLDSVIIYIIYILSYLFLK